MKSKNGFLEISFTWLFAIIVGAVIIFLAIFTATKILNSGQAEISAETAKRIGVLLNPLESSFESGTSASFSIPIETKIYTSCDPYRETFGRQTIAIAQKNLNKKWSSNETYVGFQNKYLFFENEIEGKEFYLFSKPFYFPFKVADLIYVIPSSRIYCFEQTSNEDIRTEIEFFGQKNLLVENCTNNEKAIQVCESSDCDIVITPDYILKPDGLKNYYETDALMYAAIFSEKGLYDCQVARLMGRAGKLAELYQGKSSVVSRSGCQTNFDSELTSFKSGISNIIDGEGLATIFDSEEKLKQSNDDATCKLW